jgi:hypothetical protein
MGMLNQGFLLSCEVILMVQAELAEWWLMARRPIHPNHHHHR